jgi:hypothetical protein
LPDRVYSFGLELSASLPHPLIRRKEASLRRVLIVVDTFLAVLFALSVVGILIVLSGSVMDLDILIFFVVLGVPYGLLRFVILGNPLPFTALPKSEPPDV